MKKNLIIISCMIILTFAFSMQGFGIEAVPPAVQPSVTAEDLQKAVRSGTNGISEKLRSIEDEVSYGYADTAKGIDKVNDNVLKGYNKTSEKLKDADKKTGKLLDRQHTYAADARDNEVISVQILAAVIGVSAILIIVIIVVLNRGLHRRTLEVTAAVNESTNAITPAVTTVINESHANIVTAIDNLRENLTTQIKAVPADTAALVKELDPSLFIFSVAGHVGTYASPPEGIDEGFYLTLKVEEMPDGKDNPATYVRQMEHKRHLVAKYVVGTMKKFFEGKLKGEPEEKLIQHLVTTGEIKYRKIS